MPPTAASHRSFFARSRSRRAQPMPRKAQTPMTMERNCLLASPGTTAAMAAMPMVEMKKAMVSTSKEVLRIQK